MANGHAAPRALELDSITASKPDAAGPLIEITIAAAVASATMAFVAGVIDWQALGAMTPAVREQNGELLARVVELELAHLGEIDFDAVRLESRRVLHQRHGDAFRAVDCDAVMVDAGFDELIGYVLTIANNVVASELAFRSH